MTRQSKAQQFKAKIRRRLYWTLSIAALMIIVQLGLLAWPMAHKQYRKRHAPHDVPATEEQREWDEAAIMSAPIEYARHARHEVETFIEETERQAATLRIRERSVCVELYDTREALKRLTFRLGRQRNNGDSVFPPETSADPGGETQTDATEPTELQGTIEGTKTRLMALEKEASDVAAALKETDRLLQEAERWRRILSDTYIQWGPKSRRKALLTFDQDLLHWQHALIALGDNASLLR
ncbi:MAG: hypothetical protein K9N51_07105 [Candidatus Pacebacteria bacterium]|nr:hypothetical protein [Candidatus Paceibacterota bacterium]